MCGNIWFGVFQLGYWGVVRKVLKLGSMSFDKCSFEFISTILFISEKGRGVK